MATTSPPLTASALLGSGPFPAVTTHPLANLSSLSLARDLHGDRCQVRGLEQIIAEGRFSFYLSEQHCTDSLARLRNKIVRQSAQYADLMTPFLGAACPQCAAGKLVPDAPGAFMCDPCGEMFALECGELVEAVTCDECANVAVKADCLTDGDDYWCDSCCEGAREARYQQTGRL